MKKLIKSSVFYKCFLFCFLFTCNFLSCTQKNPGSHTKTIAIAKGWAQNSINAVIFRKNSVVSYQDYQFVAFYDSNGYVILAKRRHYKDQWQIKRTPYTGNIYDAHNSISIMVDGGGFLHMAWDHHNSPLKYCRSIEPGSLEMTDTLSMTGINEDKVSYPEFYKLPGGNLIFIYRDGASGMGNIMMHYYDASTQTWTNIQNAFIDGQGQRNAYWQAAIDNIGSIHISWTWRETWDVATNHDICYAKSEDSGLTWMKSDGEKYQLPITVNSAEVVEYIPQGSELINQTSMDIDDQGNPFIVSYWREENDSIPQYRLIYNKDGWRTSQISNRKTPFTLSGGGTKKIPISRPQVMVINKTVYMLYRDEERQNRISVAICADIENQEWIFKDLTAYSVNSWEPSYDSILWRSKKELHIFSQKVGQGDNETTESLNPQMVSVIEWKPDY